MFRRSPESNHQIEAEAVIERPAKGIASFSASLLSPSVSFRVVTLQVKLVGLSGPCQMMNRTMTGLGLLMNSEWQKGGDSGGACGNGSVNPELSGFARDGITS